MNQMNAKQFFENQRAKGVTNVFEIMDAYADHRIAKSYDVRFRELFEHQQSIMLKMDDQLAQMKREYADAVDGIGDDQIHEFNDADFPRGTVQPFEIKPYH